MDTAGIGAFLGRLSARHGWKQSETTTVCKQWENIDPQAGLSRSTQDISKEKGLYLNSPLKLNEGPLPGVNYLCSLSVCEKLLLVGTLEGSLEVWDLERRSRLCQFKVRDTVWKCQLTHFKGWSQIWAQVGPDCMKVQSLELRFGPKQQPLPFKIQGSSFVREW